MVLLGTAGCFATAASILLLLTAHEDPLFDSRFNYKRGGAKIGATHSVSPNGLTIVCDRWGTEQGHLFQVRREGSHAVPLAASSQFDCYPVYSPSGRRIAFTRETGGYEHVWLMDANGSNQMQVTHGRILDRVHCFSSDEKRIFVVRTSWYGRALKPKSGIFGISLLGEAMGRAEKLGDGIAISPDGNMVLYEKPAGERNSGLWVTNRVDRRAWLVGQGSCATFSSDGRRIVYLYQGQDFRHDVFTVNVDGTGQVKMPSSPGFKQSLSFCLADGAITFFMEPSPRDGPGGVFIVTVSDYRQEIIRI